MDRAHAWLAQAKRDLEQADDSRAAGRHEWACFAAHQAAEKAVKALHLSQGQDAWGHAVARLLAELPASVPEDLVEKGHPEGAPFEHYGPLQSEEAIRLAGEIVGFAGDQMAQPG
jgi:HEPN domain-containing protein